MIKLKNMLAETLKRKNIHNLGTDELSTSDFDYLPANVDEVWYIYESGYYEGSGHIVLRSGDKWAEHDMGHCSCYGPLDHIENIGNLKWYNSLNALKRVGTQEYSKTLFDIIKYIKQNTNLNETYPKMNLDADDYYGAVQGAIEDMLESESHMTFDRARKRTQEIFDELSTMVDDGYRENKSPDDVAIKMLNTYKK